MVGIHAEVRSEPRQARSELVTLRADTLRLMLLAVAVLFPLAVWFMDGRRPETWVVPVLIPAACLLSHKAQQRSTNLGAGAFLVGLLAILTAALWGFPGAMMVVFFSLLPVAGLALFGTIGGLVSALPAVAVVLATFILRPGLIAPEVALAALGTIGAGTSFVWIALRPLNTALHWAWQSYEQARERREEARDRQAELHRLSKSLAEACYRLEKANEELDRARQAAEEARRLKAQFAAAISHELRTPLNLIIGFSEMLMLDPESYGGEPLPAAYRGDVQAIYRNARHLASLVDDVLDLSQIEAGRMGLNREEASLAAIVQEALDVVRSIFVKKGLSLVAEVVDNLPPLYVDRARLRQVLINLLNNAARFTQRGGVTVTIRQDGDAALLSVTDTGVGIPAADLSRLFQEFSQVGGTAEPDEGGSGLGLAVSRRCVELHGGRMWAESEVGRGTTFSFTLPLQDTLVTSSPPPDFDPRLARLVRGGDGRRTLVVVDPDPASARILHRYLDGYEVVRMTAVDAQRATDLTTADAIVITSRQGEAELHRLRQAGQLPHHAPIALFSLPGPRKVGQRLGVRAYLLKPVSREELRQALGGLGRRARSILVVDDEPDMVRLLARMVQGMFRNCRILKAYGGAEALALLKTERPDAVLLDLLMPEVDGYTVLAHLQADPDLRSVPVVVVTARGDADESIVIPTISITRDGGLTVGDLVRCLRTTLDALRVAPRADTVPAPPAGPAG